MVGPNGQRMLKDPQASIGCIRWLKARQTAVDDAKAAIQPRGVEVSSYLCTHTQTAEYAMNLYSSV